MATALAPLQHTTKRQNTVYPIIIIIIIINGYL